MLRRPGIRQIASERVIWDMAGLSARVKDWARAMKRDVIALWYGMRDPRVPWHAKAVAACVVAYALSPIDLIPDFIPVLGYVDDLVVVPLGVLFAVKLIPPDLMRELRARASAHTSRPTSRAGAVLIVAIWIALAVVVGIWLWPGR
jgi:uncharacterized membrane protein YkvA (DUF1232 family)